MEQELSERFKEMVTPQRQNQDTTLVEANRLAAAGLRQAALDLLLESIEINGQSPRVLAAIGRLYLLERQYPQSITYLQRSLNLQKAETAKGTVVDAYGEEFGTEDLAYVESQENEAGEDAENLAVHTAPPIAKSTSADVSVVADQDEVQIEHAERPIDVQPATNDEPRIVVPPPAISDQLVLSDDLFDEMIPDVQPIPVLDRPAELDLVELYGQEIVVDDPSEEIALLDDELLVDNFEVIDSDESLELNWEEIDDLDDYSDGESKREFERVVSKGRLSREQRARQVAVEVLDRHEWGKEHLPLLTTIFFENGWGAARVAIEREILQGTSPEELAVAREIRHFWHQSERYWITYRGLYSNGMNQQAEASYRNMSWAEALRLVDCFPGIPSIEEIEDLIEEAFLLWYENRRLSRSFPVFFKFLKYRTASMPGTLSRSEPRCFGTFQGDGVEDDLWPEDEQELRSRLGEIGIDIFKPHESEKRLIGVPQEEKDDAAE